MDDTTAANQDTYFSAEVAAPAPAAPAAAPSAPTQETYVTEDGTTMFGMHSDVVGEDEDRADIDRRMPFTDGYTNVTHYADDAEREAHLAYVDEEGLYRAADGSLLDSASAGTLHRQGIGGHIFVADESGQGYVADALAEQAHLNADQDETGVHQYYHHSSLLAGDPASAAGEKYFEEGQLAAISDASGHYYDRENRREATQTQQTLLADLDAGADLSGTNVHLIQKTLPDGTVLPATDSTVDEFLDAEADQELLYTLQLSAQEEYDRQAAVDPPEEAIAGYIGDGAGEEDTANMGEAVFA